MATLDSLIAHLQQAVDRIRQAVEQVRRAKDTAKECRTRSHALGIVGVARRFQAIADRTDELERVLVAGIDAVERLIAQVEAIRHGGGTAGGMVGGAATVPEPIARPETRIPVTPGWRQRFAGDVPGHIRKAGAEMRPRAPEEKRFTTGILNGEKISSGWKGRADCTDLDPSPLSGLPVVFDEHVESKVAARMRDEARRRTETPPHSEVIIDNTTCGTNEWDRNDPWTCDKTLSSILPRGSTLVVWATCDGGRSFWRRSYFGTGERIRR